ncbi:MAG: phage tail protein [Chloroflexota bacterium]|nr:MAG: phage tail protein [Chloroflexota bacterium]
MAPYIGEIRMFAGNFPINGWVFCEGQLLPISENDALFTLLGTTYGGDGETTFGVPDLRGRIPIHKGTGPGGITYQMGEMGGVEEVTLTVNQIPSHNHPVLATSANATSQNPSNRLLAAPTSIDAYRVGGSTPPIVDLHANSVAAAGGSLPHTNLQPYLCINFIISLYGIFPSET